MITRDLLERVRAVYVTDAEGVEAPDQDLVALVEDLTLALDALDLVSMEHSTGRELGLGERVALLASVWRELDDLVHGTGDGPDWVVEARMLRRLRLAHGELVYVDPCPEPVPGARWAVAVVDHPDSDDWAGRYIMGEGETRMNALRAAMEER